MLKLKIFYFFFSIVIFNNYSQKPNFQLYGDHIKSQSINFKLINNLIIIPLTVNKKKLSFILDTGVNHTLLFNTTKNDSIQLHNLKRINLQALGKQKPLEAIISTGNHFQIKNIISPKEDLYVILNDNLNISAKMGETIHGIIGYNLLKNFVTKINYSSKKITFYNPANYKYKSCKNCEIFPLQFYKNKPYVNSYIQMDTVTNKKTAVKLLIDTGGSDALWLFEGSKKNIVTPKKYFKDFLGEGINGTIYGNRSKIPEFSLGKFKIPTPTVSFLDTLSTHNARLFKERNGSIGGNILKHFTIWIDYTHKKIKLKKKSSLKKEYFYNMSGISVTYHGEVLTFKKETIDSSQKINSNNTISLVTNYVYQFKPSYKIDYILKNSPAFNAGLLKGDLIKKINNKVAYEYELSDIIHLFQSKPHKEIRLEIERLGKIHRYKFKLKKRI